MNKITFIFKKLKSFIAYMEIHDFLKIYELREKFIVSWTVSRSCQEEELNQVHLFE